MAKEAHGWQPFCRRMLASLLRRAARCLPACSLWLCSGCGATGLAWVDEAHHESMQQQHVSAASVTTASIPATAEPSSPDARPRLSRTVTLGEIDVVATRTAPPAASGPSVIVNNYNQVNVVSPTVGAPYYGYSRYSPGFLPGRGTPSPSRPSASGPLPGQNWPAVADHGPSFPYPATPASPWTRTQ